MIVETCPRCGTPVIYEVIDIYPPITVVRCYKCGWSYEYGREPIEYKPWTPPNEGDIALD